MIINHPLLGPRDSEEFVYLGSTDLIDRPTNWEEDLLLKIFTSTNISEKILLVNIANFGITNREISLG